MRWLPTTHYRRGNKRVSEPFWACVKAEQKLSYRKQIARKLSTQFVEDISVTLKSTLRVTQGHWKRKYWTNHTRLTSRRVIGRWILSWPWNVGQRSLKIMKLVPFESLGVVSYSLSIVTMAVFVAVCEIFSVKEWRDLENQVRGPNTKIIFFDTTWNLYLN